MAFFDNIKFNEQGLVPCVAQDFHTREVLMLAWMNEESLRLTLETGYCVYYSRSRRCLWKKGETSGHVQKVVSLTADCDGDTILALVEQTGSACHTGNRTCFFTPEEPSPAIDSILRQDYDVIAGRRELPDDGSYTSYLFEKGMDKICKKIGEESAEIIIASKNGIKADTVGEMSDFLYHMMVLMVECGIRWEDIYAELWKRRGVKSQKVEKLRKRDKKEE